MVEQDYERIIEALKVNFNGVDHAHILQSVKVRDYKNINNQFLMVRKGRVTFEHKGKRITLCPGEMAFIPEFTSVFVTYGSREPIEVSHSHFSNHQKHYLDLRGEYSMYGADEVFSTVSFNTKIYSAIQFFRLMELSVFKIIRNPKLYALVEGMFVEASGCKLGKKRVLKALLEQLLIELIRHLFDNSLFLEQFVLKSVAFTDKRLLKLFKYIADNMEQDLSNSILAKQVGLTKDYVGQFFKINTKLNLQQYVDTTRLNKVVELLRTTNMKVSEVGRKTGFKNLAYFCRKFKTFWGTTARNMRRYHKGKQQ